MVKRLARTQLYSTRDPAHFHDGLLKDVKLLWDAESFPSCVTLMACFIDALAAKDGEATKPKFRKFMEQHFRLLCDELHSVAKSKPGALTFYEQFRNGLAHLRGPKSHYALARASETDGKYVEVFEVEHVGRFIGINVDRLHTDFIAAVESCRAAP
jgi:hypothetical protein